MNLCTYLSNIRSQPTFSRSHCIHLYQISLFSVKQSEIWVRDQCQASCREKVKNLPVFCKCYNSVLFLFQCQKQYQCHLMAIFHEISVQMASAPCFDTTRPALLCKSCCFYAINWNFQSIISIRKRGQPHPHVYSKVRILIDCEQSLFFFRFSENNCTRAGAAEPRDERNEGGSPKRKQKDCPLSQSQ